MTDSQLLQLTLTEADPLVGEHRKDGRALLPAAVQIELALVATGGTELRGVSFRRPVVVPPDATTTVRVVRSGEGAGSVQLLADGTSGPVGAATPAAAASPPGTAPSAVAGTTWDPHLVYAAWSGAGLEYGPSYRTLTSLVVGEGAAEAVLRSADTRPWIGHPLLLDGVLQLSSVVLQEATAPGGLRPLYPVGVDRLVVHAPLRGPEVSVRAWRTAPAEHGTGRCDAMVLDGTGRVVAELVGLRMRGVPMTAAAPSEAVTARTPAPAPAPMRVLRWSPSGPGSAPAPGGRWVVLHHGGPRPPGAEAAAALRAAGSRVEEVADGIPDLDGLTRLWDEAAAGRLDGVVMATAVGDPADDGERDLLEALHVVRSLTERRRKGLRLVVLTERAAAAAPDDRPDPGRASVWGLLRTAAVEYPGLSLRMIDLASTGTVDADDLGIGPAESAIRGGGTTVPRLGAPARRARDRTAGPGRRRLPRARRARRARARRGGTVRP